MVHSNASANISSSQAVTFTGQFFLFATKGVGKCEKSFILNTKFKVIA